jgi:N-methylhydantoinase A
MIIGIDTGGTFTDFIFIDGGAIHVRKVPSTQDDPSKAILAGLREFGLNPGASLNHGTTVATNALLERRGAKTALITTQGCRDVLEIARQTRDELYSLSPSARQPLIPRQLRFEVPERLDWQGQVVTELDTNAVERVLDAIEAEHVESLAVCFLFSFLRPDHEQEVGRLARNRGLSVSLSCEVAPESREYERTSTVCANAFVAPVMARYIGNLQERLAACGVTRLSIMQSNGGTLRAEEASENAIKTALSGPAGGLVAAMKVAKQAGIQRVLTFDMGGTSTDVALIDGEARTMRTGEVAGLPVLTPMLDIHTVGAGGGSLARLDAGGALKVGPQSAGADPGPVAYGRGTGLTVTDANVLLGRLPATVQLAGRLPLDIERVREQFKLLAEQMNTTPENAALGIIEVVNAQMARALRHISTERGQDPAQYTLFSFGGAGGLHACSLATAIGTATILIPRYPGAFSALGLALADAKREAARSHFVRLDGADSGSLNAIFREMLANSEREIGEEGVPTADITSEKFVEARYVGQSYALRVPYTASLRKIGDAFHRAHRARYGHSDPDQPVEIVALGVTAIGKSHAGEGIRPPELPSVAGAPVEIVMVHIENKKSNCPLFLRESLAAGQQLNGPAIVIQEDATTYIAPKWTALVDGWGNLLLRH